MKKILLPLAAATLAAGSLLTACRGVIFDTIRDEIALDDAQITGDVNSIVRYTYNSKEYLFVQNGTIWMKDVDDAANGTATTEEPASGYNGNWERVPQPAANIIKLAADGSYLYALSAPVVADNDDTGDNIETGRIVYYTEDPVNGEWTAINFGDSYGSTISTSYSVNLFCTNTPQNANRHAFVNIGSAAVFKLNGATASDISDSTSYKYISGTDTPTDEVPAGAKSATVLGSSVYFSTYYAMTSNETRDDPASYIYYATGDDLYYYDGTTATQDSSDPGDSIYAMAFTSDYLLLGTESGLVYVTIDGNVPGSTASSVTNASSTLSSYYEVWAVLSADPSLSATSGDQYGATTFSGTSASFSNVCLWGYYPGRSKWNCE